MLATSICSFAAHPVDAGNYPGSVSRALEVENLHRPQARSGGNTHNADAVIERTNGSGHMCAVIVIIIPALDAFGL
jgi:hypothetical protein